MQKKPKYDVFKYKQERFKQELYVDKADYCINYLLEQLKKLEIGSNKILQNKFTSNELKLIKDGFDLKETLVDVSELEQNLGEKPPLSAIKALALKYQQVHYN